MNKQIYSRVSIIVVSYNHMKFLRSCIESILSQTYKNIEIIIVDNNSEDGSHEILENYREHYNIKIIYLDYNMGLCGGINEGLKYVTGEFVTFFASDDIMVSSRLEKQVAFLQSSPKNIVGCFGNMLAIQDDDSIASDRLLPMVAYKRWTLDDILFNRIQLYSPTQLYRSFIFSNDIQSFPENIKIEDIWLYHKIFNKGYYLYTLPYLLTFYRIHNGNTHTKYKMMMEHKLMILDEYKTQPYYNAARRFIYLEHFSNFGSTNKRMAMKLLPKIFYCINSKYLYIGLIRLLFDWRGRWLRN